MRKLIFLPRFLALWLILSLSHPYPAFALRQTGLEEQEINGKPVGPKAQLLKALDTSSFFPAAGGAEERMPGEGHPAHPDSRVINNVVLNFSEDAPFAYDLDDKAQQLLREFLSEGKLSMVVAVRKMAEFSGRFGILGENQANNLLSQAWIAAQGGGLSPSAMFMFSMWESMSHVGDKPLNAAWLKDLRTEMPNHSTEQIQRLYQQYKDLIRIARTQPVYNKITTSLMEIQGHLEDENWAGLLLAMRQAEGIDKLLAILPVLLTFDAAYLESGALRNYVILLRSMANLNDSQWPFEMERIAGGLDDVLDPAQSDPITFSTRFSETFSSTGWSGEDRNALIRMVNLLQQGGAQMTPQQEAISENLAVVGAHLMLRLEEVLVQDAQDNGWEDLPLLRSKVEFLRYHAGSSAYEMLKKNPSHAVWMSQWVLPYLSAGAEENAAVAPPVSLRDTYSGETLEVPAKGMVVNGYTANDGRLVPQQLLETNLVAPGQPRLLVPMSRMGTGLRLYVQSGLLDEELIAVLRSQNIEVKKFMLSDIPEVNPQAANVFVAAVQPNSDQERRMHSYGSTLINLYGSKPVNRPQTPTALATLIRTARQFDGLLRLEGITVDEVLGLAALALAA